MKKVLKYIVAAVLVAGVAASTVLSVVTIKSVKAMQKDVNEYTGNTEDIAAENDVEIADQYFIRSTTDISDAYKSGDSSALDDRGKETLKMASDALKKIITGKMNDYQKETAVYKWMTSELKKDSDLLLVIPSSDKDSDNPYGVLKYHNAVCVGYATTFRLFMQMMNIECMVVHNKTLYHSWDLVKLDGDWYHTDIYSDEGVSNFRHFNMNDLQCSQDNEWNTDFFPAANGTKYSYAHEHIKTVKDIYAIPAEVKKAFDNNENCIFLGFKSKIDEPTAKIAQNIVSNISQCTADNAEYSAYTITSSWSNTDGKYFICIYIDGMSGNANSISQDALDKTSIAIGKAFGTQDFVASDNSSNEENGCDK